MTGIVVSDYFLVRHGEYHIGDMYMGNSRSAYWYTGGFNWRCFTAWILGMAPLLREFLFFSLQKLTQTNSEGLAGFARAVQGVSNADGWDHLYEMSYLYGFFATLTAHWLLHAVFPAARQRGSSPFVLEEHAQMIHLGESDSGTVADEEKVVSGPKS